MINLPPFYYVGSSHTEYFEFFGEEVGFHHIDILDCNLILDPVEVDPTDVIEPFAADRRDPVEYYENNGVWPPWGAALELPELPKDPNEPYEIFAEHIFYALDLTIRHVSNLEKKMGYTTQSAALRTLCEAREAARPGGVGIKTKRGISDTWGTWPEKGGRVN
jgi:hypothetical protein